MNHKNIVSLKITLIISEVVFNQAVYLAWQNTFFFFKSPIITDNLTLCNCYVSLKAEHKKFISCSRIFIRNT